MSVTRATKLRTAWRIAWVFGSIIVVGLVWGFWASVACWLVVIAIVKLADRLWLPEPLADTLVRELQND